MFNSNPSQSIVRMVMIFLCFCPLFFQFCGTVSFREIAKKFLTDDHQTQWLLGASSFHLGPCVVTYHSFSRHGDEFMLRGHSEEELIFKNVIGIMTT